MKKRIFHSIFIVAILVLLASIGIATSFLYESFNSTQIKQLKEELSLVANTVNNVGNEYFENFDSAIFRFTVVNKEGKVLYDTQVDPEEMENHKERTEIKEAFVSGNGSSARFSSTLTKMTLYEAILLDSGDVLRISISQPTIGGLLIQMFPAILSIFVVATLLAILLSHTMAKKLTAPITMIDLEHPTVHESYVELEPILSTVQKQNKQIKYQKKTIRQKSDEFEQILSSMNEGLVLLNDHGMVLTMNQAAKKIFGVKNEFAGKDFLLVDTSNKMNKAIWDALDGRRTEYTEERNGLEYEFTINSIQSDNKVLGVFILIIDITDRAFAERNRREFTANVTHELKTPLQVITGSAELLETGLVKTEDIGRFASNIKREADRLVHLINDIIRLSQLDENHDPVTEKVDLISVANEVIDALSFAAARKNVLLRLDGDNGHIFGVHRYIYDIIYNLCDNAIRYNKEGGTVIIRVFNENGNTVCSISDNGIGIPLEHQNRIFERFYRVDKSHSKETGGTGLGLSIVKHAVQYHGGKVFLESEVGEGTTITVVF